MGISGTEKDFCHFTWTRQWIDFIDISTFTFVQYFLLIHIKTTVFGTRYPILGVKIFPVSNIIFIKSFRLFRC